MKFPAFFLLGAALHGCNMGGGTPTVIDAPSGLAATTASQAPSATTALVPELSTATAAAPTLPPPTHFVVLLIDDLAIPDANFMGAGAPKRYTPNLDALAAQSTVLGNYHSVTPVCTASRYSLLTGTYPSRATNTEFVTRLTTEGMAVPSFNTLIDSKTNTLPKRMKALGYRTGFTGKNHVTAWGNFVAQGSSFSNAAVVKAATAAQKTYARDLNQIGFDDVYSIYPTNPLELPIVESRVHNLEFITDGALKFIDANRANKFFLYVAMTVPHGPIDPARTWLAHPRATPFAMLPAAPNVMPARSTLTPRVNAAGFPGTETYLWLDDAVGAILARLKQYGLMESTAIIVQGDHGMNPKATIHYGGSKTPGLWYYRGLKGRTDQLASMIDLQPTVLAMAGATPVGDGVSLVPLLLDPAKPIRNSVYMELGYARALLQGDYQYITLRHSNYITAAAAQKGFALTQYPTAEYGVDILETTAMKQFPSYAARDQLYNVTADPRTQSNLFGQATYQPVIDLMAATLQAQVNALPGTYRVIK